MTFAKRYLGLTAVRRHICSWGTRTVAIKVPTKSVITIVHSHERPTLLMKWLAVVAWLSLFFAGAPAFAGTEQRCTGLGAQCICGEPLNTATHDGGNATFTPGQMYNLDDSPPSKECFAGPNIGYVQNDSGTPSDPSVELYCGAQFIAVPTSALSGVVPPSNTLSYVLRDQGGGICHIMHPRLVEAPNMTYCLRAYSRWDAASPMPDEFNLGQQQKIMTIAGFFPGWDYLTAQISLGDAGSLHTRFDGGMFAAPVDFQLLGSARSDCTNNFCRFELCFDYSSVGEGRVRMRRTSVAPGSGQVTVFKPVGTVTRPSGLDLQNVPGGGLAMYAQAMTIIRDNTHFIVTRVRPENRDFWPGPACEVEGGCSGSTAIPGAPASLILK